MCPRGFFLPPILLTLIGLLTAGCVESQAPVAPAADHHLHLQSRRAADVLVRLKLQFKEPVEPGDRMVVGAAEAIGALDAALIRKGVVVSAAYLLGTSDIVVADEYQAVQEENDWTAAEARRYPGRLVGFCSVNPLKDYAEVEVSRCAAIGLGGLKLHFTNSAVDLRDADHVKRVRRVFAAANANRLPMLVHMRTRARSYGAREAETVLAQVLPAAPDVPVVLAHMSGWGGFDRATDGSLGAFSAACAARSPVCRHLLFDLAFTVLPAGAADATPGSSLRSLADAQRDLPDANERLVRHIRKIGVDRIVFGSDWPGMSPLDAQDAMRRQLPIARKELTQIFSNVAPCF
ncbi:MAG TPA: amidohydrolase family protein [Vicinamibacterales bacterium]|jgi:predicted TIM-barrel fold metal-dependent hydrolase